MEAVSSIAASKYARIKLLDHATAPSIDIMRDLVFYEKFLGARLMQREPGMPPLRGHPPPFVNLKTERMKAGRYCNCFILFPGGGELGLFLQPDYPPAPDRLLQGQRIGLAASGDSLAAAADALDTHDIPFLGPVAQEAESPFGESIYFQDPSGNSLEVSTWKESQRPPAAGDEAEGLIPVTGLAHVALDVTDLDSAEEFYTAAVGFEFSHRGATADGLEKSVLRARSGQVVTLQLVDAMPQRAIWKTSGKIHFALVVDDSGWDAYTKVMGRRDVEHLPLTENANQATATTGTIIRAIPAATSSRSGSDFTDGYDLFR